MKRRDFFIGIVAASVIAAGLSAYGVYKFADSRTGSVKRVEYVNSGVGSHFTAYDRDNYPDLTYAAENAVEAVVNIENTQEIRISGYGNGGRGGNPFYEFFGIPEDGYRESQPHEQRSGGSGAIISPDGYIVTNNHVIENASKLKVTLNDGKIYEGRLIGTDPTTDVALIKIDAQDLPSLPFGNSDDLRLGEWVLAIGSPFDLRSTVTAGIISAKARDIGIIPSEFRIESFIQTDAAVNRGNSGGALVNVRGELVGINTAIQSTASGGFIGYSFAVPSSIVQKVVMDLKEYGVVQRAMIGISYQPIDDRFIEQMGEETGITEIGGAYVAEVVEGGGAEAAGIEKGDVITEIDGHKITSTSSISEQVARHRPGEKVTLMIKRDGKTKQIEVLLRNKAGKAELLKKDYVDPVEALGGTFAEISEKAKKEFRIDGGVVVRSVKSSGILDEAGIREGYILTSVNGRTIRSTTDIMKITDKVTSINVIDPQTGERIRLILRGGDNAESN